MLWSYTRSILVVAYSSRVLQHQHILWPAADRTPLHPPSADLPFMRSNITACINIEHMYEEGMRVLDANEKHFKQMFS